MDSKSLKRKLIGRVVSDKMQKTVMVKVESIKVHPKYKKRYKVSKKFAAHVSEGEYKVGERVEIEEHKPFSKTKNWIVIRKVA